MRRGKMCLCLDGGGIRIIATLAFLDELRQEIGVPILDVFSILVGTSAGALVAYAMVCEEDDSPLLDRYVSKMVELFRYPARQNNLLLRKYSGDRFEALFRSIYGVKQLKDIPNRWRVLTTSYNMNRNRIHIFDSWDKGEENTEVVDCSLATCALPSFVPPHEIKGEYYIDGAIKCSNPLIFCISRLKTPEMKVLNIGTGASGVGIDGKRASSWGMLRWLGEGLVDIITTSHDLNIVLGDMLGANYMRLDFEIVDMGLDNVQMGNIVELVKCGKQLYWDNAGAIKTFLDII